MSILRFRGDTKPIVITLSTAAGPINLTGCTAFKMTADPSKTPTDAAANIFSLSGTVLSAVDGTVEFLPSAAETDHVGTYYFDVQFLDARGFINTAGKDKIVFEQDISK